MNWENLTAPEFKNAVEMSKKLCILPLGVIEKHSDHLPLGTDVMIVQYIAQAAARKEPVVVFPTHAYTQIFEAKHWPGTIAIKRSIMFDLLENVCDEIGRNGFSKIYLLNGHGGNNHFLPFFLQSMLEKEKSFTLYYSGYGFAERYKDIIEIIDSGFDYHAGEVETSLMMALYPDLVTSDKIPGKPSDPLKRLQLPKGIETSIQWYADFPNHYAGNAQTATKEKGQKIFDICLEYVVTAIRAIKEDTAAPGLMEKFFNRISH